MNSCWARSGEEKRVQFTSSGYYSSEYLLRCLSIIALHTSHTVSMEVSKTQLHSFNVFPNLLMILDWRILSEKSTQNSQESAVMAGILYISIRCRFEVLVHSKCSNVCVTQGYHPFMTVTVPIKVTTSFCQFRQQEPLSTRCTMLPQ